MDSHSDARPAGHVSSAYHSEGTTDVGVTTQSASSTTDTWTSARLDSQSRSNLRQASVALDTAYERITSLRNSINSMLNRIPPEVAGTSTPSPASGDTNTNDTQPRHPPNHDASIRPPHSALVLSGEQVVEELNLRAARLRTLVSPSARQRLEEFESNSRNTGNARGELVWDRFSQNDRPRLGGGDIHTTPTRPRTPPMPDLIFHGTRSLQSAHRDESSTMIGRRVAARENAVEGQGSLSSRLSLTQIEQRLQAQTAQVARELENMTERLATSRSRGLELASTRSRGENDPNAAQDNVPSTANGDLRSVPNPPAGGRPLRPTRNVTLIDNSRIVLPQPVSRTSSDGTPLDEVTARAHRIREHLLTTYREATTTSQDTPRNLANAPEVRGTLVNLLTRDREEEVLPRQAEHIRPGVETVGREDLSNSSSPLGGGRGRRRRGWTRLNADGDEIDSDEDDDASPQTRRLRMRFTYGTPSAEQPTTRSHTVTIEDILWRTSGSDSEPDVLSPDATESCQMLFRGSPPRQVVRHPHPLPTPAEDMLMYPAVKPAQRPRVICVSKYASLAGR